MERYPRRPARAWADLAFCGGHVEHQGWKWPKTHKNMFTPPENDLDLQDLRWLQDRLPGP